MKRSGIQLGGFGVEDFGIRIQGLVVRVQGLGPHTCEASIPKV